MAPASNRRTFIGLLGAGAAGADLLGRARAEAAEARASAPLPITAGVFDVLRFGAVGDGRTPCGEALQKAIDACAAAGGGTVLVPAGRFLTAALVLRSHVHLHLDAGAVLVASERFEDFPPMKGRHEGIERTIYAALISGVDLENVAVTGRGTIDGQGSSWWQADEATRKMRVAAKMPREADNPANAPLKWPRPRVINLLRCKDVAVDGITIKDGVGYNVHLVYCEDAVVQGMTTFQQRHVEGTDSIVIDSTRRVRISGCALSSGGDCIGVKSGYNEDGRRVGIPSEDVLITGCHMHHSAGSALGVGSEMSAGVRNVVFAGCVVEDCYRGLHIRAPRGRGGVVEKVTVDNVIFDRIEEMAIKVSHFYDSVKMEGRLAFKTGPGRQNIETARSRAAPVDEGTPTFRHFIFSNLTMGRVVELGLIEGLPERFIHGLVFRDITVAQGRGGLACSMVNDLTVSNVAVDALETPVVDVRDSQRLEVHRVRCAHPAAGTPVLWLENVAGAFLHGCDVGDGGAAFEWCRQEQSRNVVFGTNNVPVRPPAAPPPAKKG
jgi:hypothetical protein